jgi:hypothetical protein
VRLAFPGWALLTCLLASLTTSMQAEAAPRQTPPAPLQALRIRELWKSNVAEYANSKSFPDEKVRVLKRLLDDAPTNVVENEFVRVCSTTVPAVSCEPFDYDTVLLQTMVSRAVEQKNGEMLVRLLRSNCPQYVGFLPTEYYLARASTNAFSSLFDGFASARSGEAKRRTLTCLARAFASLRSQYSDDQAFVSQAKHWYAEHRGSLALNPDYPHLGARPAFPLSPSIKDLFVTK